MECDDSAGFAIDTNMQAADGYGGGYGEGDDDYGVMWELDADTGDGFTSVETGVFVEHDDGYGNSHLSGFIDTSELSYGQYHVYTFQDSNYDGVYDDGDGAMGEIDVQVVSNASLESLTVSEAGDGDIAASTDSPSDVPTVNINADDDGVVHFLVDAGQRATQRVQHGAGARDPS